MMYSVLVNNYVLVQSTCHDSNNFILKNDSFIMATYVPSEYCGRCHDQMKYMISTIMNIPLL